MPSRPNRDISVKLRSPTEQSTPTSAIQRLTVHESEGPVQQQQQQKKQPQRQASAATAVKQQLQVPRQRQRRLFRGERLQHQQHADHARKQAACRSGNPAVDCGRTPVTVISRKAGSVAYYVDMESPEDRRQRLALLAAAAASASPSRFCYPWLSPAILTPQRSPTTPSFEASSSTFTTRLVCTMVASSQRSSDINPQSRNLILAPQGLQPRARCQKEGDLAAAITAKLSRACARRAAFLRERSQTLRRRFEMVRHRAILQQHRRHIMTLRFRARHDFAMSSAYLKRQILIRQRASLCAAAVERAHAISMLNRLTKEVKLRRAYSESLAAFLRDPTVAGTKEVRARQRRASISGNCFSSERYTSSSCARSRKRSLSMVQARSSSPPCPGTEFFCPPTAEQCVSFSEDDTYRSNTSDERLARGDSGLVSPSDSHISDESLEWDDWLRNAREAVQAPLRPSISCRRPSMTSPELTDAGTDKDSVQLSSILSAVQEASGEYVMSWDEEIALARRIKELRPPITRATLAELDLEEMEQNAQLRHDLVFDPKLEFRPNLAGEAGAAKRARWESYWESLRLELEGPEGATEHVPCTTRVPVLVYEIRQILDMFFDRDSLASVRQEIKSRTDVGLIAQQLSHGVFDISAFVRWFASTLRSHCRPERVSKVDQMLAAAEQGRFAEAFKTAFEALELMKLDIANFQLTHIFRPLAVQCSIQYEWNHFKLQLEAELTTLDRTISWLKRGAQRNPGKPFDEIFFECVVDLVTTSVSDAELPEPETFHMDGNRLYSFYNDYQDISVIATILLLFRQLAGPRCSVQAARDLKTELWVLLLEPDTTMAHISAHIISGAERARGLKFSTAERRVAEGLIDRTLVAGSKLLETVKNRVAQVLTAYLIAEAKRAEAPFIRKTREPGRETKDVDTEVEEDEEDALSPRTPDRPVEVCESGKCPSQESCRPARSFDTAMFTRFGLVDVEENLLDLAERIRELAAHNRCVFHPGYQAIWECLDDFDNEEESDVEIAEDA